jgi:hypothetical protein
MSDETLREILARLESAERRLAALEAHAPVFDPPDPAKPFARRPGERRRAIRMTDVDAGPTVVR